MNLSLKTMFRVCVFLFSFLVASSYANHRFAYDVWVWQCQGEQCVRVRGDLGKEGTSLARCHLTCGKYASMFPYPTNLESLSTTVVPIHIEDMVIDKTAPSQTVDGMIAEAIRLFHNDIQVLDKNFKTRTNVHQGLSQTGNRLTGSIAIEAEDTSVYMTTDESYVLNIDHNEDAKTVHFQINAKTFFGARHALETMAQLIVYDDKDSTFLTLKEAKISDSPVFKHRGMLLDTSRHFYPMDSLKRMIDGLSMNKLNTFHWHITDSHSWPMVIPSQPNMTLFGAYSADRVYSPEDVIELVEYARVRGVRVLPELDAPFHVSQGFQWTNEMGKGEVILCDHLNPLNDYMYELLGDFYSHYMDMFDIDVFHMGADEVVISCWNSSQEIRDWIVEQGMNINDKESFYTLWSMFQTKADEALTSANNGKSLPNIVWTSDLTYSPNVDKHLDKDKFTIHVWTGKEDNTIKDLLSKGFKLIISNSDAWYLDCGFGNWCPYKTWKEVYDNSPYGILKHFGYTCEAGGTWDKECDLVLGGEACMWSEYVDAAAVEMKVWPKVAALAERLWSNPQTDSGAATPRMLRQRDRIVEKGLNADAILPGYCDVSENC